MLQEIAQYLKSLNYQQGLAIINKHCKDDYLVKLLNSRQDATNALLMRDEINKILSSISDKNIINLQPQTQPPTSTNITHTKAVNEKTNFAHTELYKNLKNKADLHYKELMHLRAVLFSSLSMQQKPSENSVRLLKSRFPLAQQIIRKQEEISMAYAIADHVKKFGTLPEKKTVPAIEAKVLTIPIYELKSKRINTLKSIARYKRLPKTNTRLNAIAKQEALLAELDLAISKL